MKDKLLKFFGRLVIKAINSTGVQFPDGVTVASLKDAREKITFLRKFACDSNYHEWSDWSSMSCGNVTDINKMKEKGEVPYSYRHCWNCKLEMPKSRVYMDGTKEENAIDYV